MPCERTRPEAGRVASSDSAPAELLAALDLDRVRETLALLEAALGQSDLMPAFEAALRRVGGAIGPGLEPGA